MTVFLILFALVLLTAGAWRGISVLVLAPVLALLAALASGAPVSAGYDERGGHMPPGLIHDHHSMGAKRHGSSDFSKMQVHRIGIAERQDEPCALAKGRADRSKDVGRCGSLIMRR